MFVVLSEYVRWGDVLIVTEFRRKEPGDNVHSLGNGLNVHRFKWLVLCIPTERSPSCTLCPEAGIGG